MSILLAATLLTTMQAPGMPAPGPQLPAAPRQAAGFDITAATAAAPDCDLEPDARGCPGYAHTRFRIAAGPAGPDAKARAFAQDGTECNLVGDRRCSSRGIPLLRSQR